MHYLKTLLAVSFATPHFLWAQNVDFDYLDGAVSALGSLIEQLVPLVVALGLLFFIWGLVQFILSSGDEDAKDVGKRRMVWGIAALFVIIAVWGIVGLLGEITGIETGGTVDIPYIEFD